MHETRNTISVLVHIVMVCFFSEFRFNLGGAQRPTCSGFGRFPIYVVFGSSSFSGSCSRLKLVLFDAKLHVPEMPSSRDVWRGCPHAVFIVVVYTYSYVFGSGAFGHDLCVHESMTKPTLLERSRTVSFRKWGAASTFNGVHSSKVTWLPSVSVWF